MITRLSDEELERYARHLVLPEVGGHGQRKLRAAKVCVIGAGGLGAPCLMYLAAAGIGTLGIVDDDTVSLSNLQRQILYTSSDLGRSKVVCAAAALEKINPHTTIMPYDQRIDAANARDILANYDLVADGCDNFATRFAVADACAVLEIPLVSAAVGQFDGQITTLKPYCGNNPSYRDLVPQVPAAGSVPTCAQVGILGALTGVVGSLQAMEVIKQALGIGSGLVGRLLLYDARDMRFQYVSYGKGKNAGSD